MSCAVGIAPLRVGQKKTWGLLLAIVAVCGRIAGMPIVWQANEFCVRYMDGVMLLVLDDGLMQYL